MSLVSKCQADQVTPRYTRPLIGQLLPSLVSDWLMVTCPGWAWVKLPQTPKHWTAPHMAQWSNIGSQFESRRIL